ncbi:1120_t:CDS:2 [Funneliformis geosporum]|nr:1120_t:CDS:2 [Funneliformis geosporum]
MTSSSLSVDISSLSYMDDVNWIASSKEDLEFILDIADEYYSLIRLKFGLFHIPIIPVLGSVRFLDILINIFNSSSFVKKQTKDTISSFITTLKSKLLTDKQLIYFFNTVLMLTLEYSLQIIPLSFNECNTLSAPIQRLLKSNSKFASSAPDLQIYNNLVIQHFIQSDAHDSISFLYNERAITKCKGCELNNDKLLNSCHNPPYS